MSQPLSHTDLIFPTQSLDFSSTLHSLKRSALSLTNRLTSITSDSRFATAVSDAYALPLVANERCGSWYIPPDRKAGSVYFKSTDGHMNEWSFNLRRLNLQVLDLVREQGGCVIVDSTRRGKSMPDALSKTVPIWCCVLNRALLPESGPHELYTPPTAVSASEHAQIERRIDGFVKDFLSICQPNLPSLRQKLQKPLRPLWVTQTSSLPDTIPSFPDFHPILLCTASRRVHGGEVSEGGYIQGAADDHEAWSHGLTPPVFWKHHDQLMCTNEQDLRALIAELVEKEKGKGEGAVPLLIEPTERLFVSSSLHVDLADFDAIISCTPAPLTTTNPDYVTSKTYLHLRLQTGKLGSRDLREQLYRLPPFIQALKPTAKILVCDPTGKDLCVGVALAVLCLYADEDGNIGNSTTAKPAKIDKTFIKKRLSWITTTSPVLNPSRETLKSVNSFLMPDRGSSSEKHAAATGPAGAASKLVLVDADGNAIDAPPAANEMSNTASQQSEQQPSANPDTDAAAGTVTQTPQQPSRLSTLFANLHTPGSWNFDRTLRSALPSSPSGTATGTATFTPFAFDGLAQLYAEEGEFVVEGNAQIRFTARRKYVYHLSGAASSGGDSETLENSDKGAEENEKGREEEGGGAEEGGETLKVLFFYEDATNASESGKTFVEMGPLTKNAETGVWEARNKTQHLCAEDVYVATWKFSEAMVEGGSEGDQWWEVRYDVCGPRKDYVSETRYTRA